MKKRKTWLWVLGWIFIFPIPLTIILVRNSRLRKKTKVILIIVIWFVYGLLMLFATIDYKIDISVPEYFPVRTEEETIFIER